MIIWLVWGKYPCEEDIDQPTVLFVASSKEAAEGWCGENGVYTYWFDKRVIDAQ